MKKIIVFLVLVIISTISLANSKEKKGGILSCDLKDKASKIAEVVLRIPYTESDPLIIEIETQYNEYNNYKKTTDVYVGNLRPKNDGYNELVSREKKKEADKTFIYDKTLNIKLRVQEAYRINGNLSAVRWEVGNKNATYAKSNIVEISNCKNLKKE